MLALMLLPFAMKNSVFSPTYTLQSYFFIPAFIPGHGRIVQPLLTPGWTLCYEMFFYLLFGLWLRYGRASTLVPYLIGVFALCIGSGYLIGLHRPLGIFFANAIVAEFLYGVVVGLLFMKKGAPSRAAGAAFIALAITAFAATATVEADFQMRWLLWGVPASLLVYGSLAFQPQGRMATLWVRLGDASYTLYLLHAFITLTLGGLLRRGLFVDRLPPDLLIVATVAGCVAAGWWAYVSIEKPLTLWIARRFSHAPRPHPVTSLPEAGTAA
jgi:peptidoglycan/LPS O-acetylase OafA/YrhL